MGEATSTITAVFALLTLAFSAGFFLIWLHARQLRDALDGQDGHRLMVIVCRLFLLNAIGLSLSTLRQVLAMAAPDETEVFRLGMALVGSILIVGAHAWVLLAIRRLIKAGYDGGDL